MAEENKMWDESNAQAWLSNSQYANPAFISNYSGGLQQLIKDAQTENGRQKIAEAFKRSQENGNDQNSGNEDKNKNDNSLVVSEGKPEKSEKNQNEDWIDQKRKTWTKWSEQEHNPAYVFDEDKEFKEGLRFDVYKTPQDKEAGNIAATVAYTAPTKVSIETEEGKVPDYEFFAKLTKDAQEQDEVKAVSFKGDMTPEFQARLAASCLENKLDMVGGPDFIDVNLLGNVSEDLKKKAEEYNKTKKYETQYTQLVTAKKAEIANLKEKDPDKPVIVDLSTKIDSKDSPEFAAVAYAAYVNAGAEVVGTEKVFNKNPEGMIYNSDFQFMPKEAQKCISEHNKKIHDRMLDRTKNRISVAKPVVAEKEISSKKAMAIESVSPMKPINNPKTQQDTFQQFVLQGIKKEPRE